MTDGRPADDAEIRAAIWQRLSHSVLGLTTQEIARSIHQSVPVVSTALLAMQREGFVAFRRRRWQLTEKPAAPDSVQHETGGYSRRSTRGGLPPPGVGAGPASTTTGPTPPDDGTSGHTKIPKSRWATFRRLCEYYAECVRLEQGTTIHAKDAAENTDFVCLAGNLNWPETTSAPEMRQEIPHGWAEFVQRAMKGQHLFLGAPLNRFQWRDPSTGDSVVCRASCGRRRIRFRNLFVPCSLIVVPCNMKDRSGTGIMIGELGVCAVRRRLTDQSPTPLTWHATSVPPSVLVPRLTGEPIRLDCDFPVHPRGTGCDWPPEARSDDECGAGRYPLAIAWADLPDGRKWAWKIDGNLHEVAPAEAIAAAMAHILRVRPALVGEGYPTLVIPNATRQTEQQALLDAARRMGIKLQLLWRPVPSPQMHCR